ncbi:MAG: Uncharacterized protein XD43_1687 [Thermococcales archaeon 44_46]|nr:MAG: Uncharacterized protein XD43_1687 [Thermococcales archaeon 44_46]
MGIKPVLMKEVWQYFANKQLAGLLANAVIILVIGMLLIVSGPRYLTSYSKQLAMEQISESPLVFGLSENEVAKMGEDAITFAALISQLSVVVILVSALSSYASIVSSFFNEKLNKTMEILFSSPLSESEILLGKLLSAVFFSLLSWGFAFASLFFLIQYLHLKALGSIWHPTLYFIIITVFVPFSMMMFSISTGLVVSVKIKSSELINLMSLPLVLTPIIISFASAKLGLNRTFQIYLLLGICSLVASLIIAMLGKRVINRLAFITN